MRVSLTSFLFAIWMISTVSALAQTTEESPPPKCLLNVLKIEFNKQDSSIDHLELFDIRRLYLEPILDPERPNHFLILARGGWLWGLFITNDSLSAVTHVVAIMKEPGIAKQFFFTIEKIRKDSVTVRGFDTQLDDLDFRERYYLLK